MKMLVVAQVSLLSAALCGTAQAKLENFVNNGSFEAARSAIVSGAYCYLGGADHACDAGSSWTGNVPLLQAANHALGNPDSPYGAVLAGVQNQDHLEQLLRLPAAGEYTLTWADAGSAGGLGDGGQGYQVSFGGVTLDAEQVGPGAGWRAHSVTFTAQGSGVLRFQGTTSGGGATAYIDNVALTAPVAETTQLSALLVGLALLAFTARGKTNKKFIV